jgi:CYTH domain-containing protein
VKIEDERRWLLPNGMPDLNTRAVSCVDKYEHITQFYTSTAKGTQRFRKAVGTNGNHYSTTIKAPKDFSAGAEWEVDTEQWVYELMLKSSIGAVEKSRTTLLVDGELFELDEFMGNCTGLVIVELEFHAPENADQALADMLHSEYLALELPGVFGESREITGDKSYSNYWLALNGIPDVVYDH